MSRAYNSPVKLPGSWEVTVQKPLDNRLVVSLKSDLTTAATWKGSGTDTNYYHYKGMLVVCLEDNLVYLYSGRTGNATDVADEEKWIPVGANNKTLGIPIYSSEYIRDNASKLPDEYIAMDSASSIVAGSTYADTIMSAVRHLQSEVAKLKNSFYYGLCSYTEGNTASSDLVIDSDEEEQEPLWAIDPEDLSEIESALIQIDSDCQLTPMSNWSFSSDTNYINIGNTVSTPELENYDNAGLEISAKVVFYSVIDPTSDNWEFNIHFNTRSTIAVHPLILKLKCSIMFVISRRITTAENTTYNKNFYWLSITNSAGDPIFLKYLDADNNWTTTELDVSSIEMMSHITLKNVKLYRLDYYTKEASFSNSANVLPERVLTDDFIFRPAHITIRSIDKYALLTQVKDRLYNNELIFCGATDDADKKGLYIKYDNELIALGSLGGSGSSSGKTTAVIDFLTSSVSLAVGGSQQNIATTNSTAVITYTSSNPSVVTVSNTGVLTAVGPGTATITASVSSNSQYTSATVSCTVTVSNTATVVWSFGENFPIMFSEGDAMITFPLNF